MAVETVLDQTAINMKPDVVPVPRCCITRNVSPRCCPSSGGGVTTARWSCWCTTSGIRTKSRAFSSWRRRPVVVEAKTMDSLVQTRYGSRAGQCHRSGCIMNTIAATAGPRCFFWLRAGTSAIDCSFAALELCLSPVSVYGVMPDAMGGLSPWEIHTLTQLIISLIGHSNCK